MSKYKPKTQCPYNEACACREETCEGCGWYPAGEQKEETAEENEEE